MKTSLNYLLVIVIFSLFNNLNTVCIPKLSFITHGTIIYMLISYYTLIYYIYKASKLSNEPNILRLIKQNRVMRNLKVLGLDVISIQDVVSLYHTHSFFRTFSIIVVISTMIYPCYLLSLLTSSSNDSVSVNSAAADLRDPIQSPLQTAADLRDPIQSPLQTAATPAATVTEGEDKEAEALDNPELSALLKQAAADEMNMPSTIMQKATLREITLAKERTLELVSSVNVCVLKKIQKKQKKKCQQVLDKAARSLKWLEAQRANKICLQSVRGQAYRSRYRSSTIHTDSLKSQQSFRDKFMLDKTKLTKMQKIIADRNCIAKLWKVEKIARAYEDARDIIQIQKTINVKLGMRTRLNSETTIHAYRAYSKTIPPYENYSKRVRSTSPTPRAG